MKDGDKVQLLSDIVLPYGMQRLIYCLESCVGAGLPASCVAAFQGSSAL